MRETESTYWQQCHFSRWLNCLTNVCSNAQFGHFDLFIAFLESGLFWDLFEGDIGEPLTQHRHAFYGNKGFVGRIQHAYVFTAAIIIFAFVMIYVHGA